MGRWRSGAQTRQSLVLSRMFTSVSYLLEGGRVTDLVKNLPFSFIILSTFYWHEKTVFSLRFIKDILQCFMRYFFYKLPSVHRVFIVLLFCLIYGNLIMNIKYISGQLLDSSQAIVQIQSTLYSTDKLVYFL